MWGEVVFATPCHLSPADCAGFFCLTVRSNWHGRSRNREWITRVLARGIVCRIAQEFCLHYSGRSSTAKQKHSRLTTGISFPVLCSMPGIWPKGRRHTPAKDVCGVKCASRVRVALFSSTSLSFLQINGESTSRSSWATTGGPPLIFRLVEPVGSSRSTFPNGAMRSVSIRRASELHGIRRTQE